MFNVKDNTFRVAAVTKAVKPRFHRSVSESFRAWSPRETERAEDFSYSPGNAPPVDPSTAAALHHLSRARDALSHDALPLAESPAPRDFLGAGRFRRSLVFDEDDSRSLVSVLSEDVDGIGDLSELERPDSACSMSSERQAGRPPAVPPKSEKALRRAKRLTTRRLKKAETKAVASVPSSPTHMLSEPLQLPHSAPVSAPIPAPMHTHYHLSTSPGFVPTATGVVSPSYPVAQRRLLQDPNSGQYYMVDVPLPAVKTKTFFDPQTGKYVRLSVRQPPPPPEGALSQPRYMLYPGYLPVPVSSLPTARSSSQMSAPATLMQEQDGLGPSGAPWGPEMEQQDYSRGEMEQQNHSQGERSQEIQGIQGRGQGQGQGQGRARLGHRAPDEAKDAALYTGAQLGGSNRHLHIISMSELEDFAMESV